MKKVFLEGLLIAAIGGSLALCGNALSPRGISLTRDFFPGTKTASTQTHSPVGAGTNALWEELSAKLKAEGLSLINGEQATALFNDPRRLQNRIVFIDARQDEPYQAGHIPGAYQFDHFHPEKFLATIVPAIQAADQVVIYCTGGHCTDSEDAALSLANFVSKEKLLVYGGGITEWTNKGLALATGDQTSGPVPQ